MSAFHRFARRAVLAAVALSAFAVAGAASANTVSIARWECPTGLWEFNTYESTNGGPEVLVHSDKTTSPCAKATAATPELNARYQLRPLADFRPQLRYQLEQPQPTRQPTVHVPLKYAF